MKKADYTAIASNYAQARILTSANVHLWLDPIQACYPGKNELTVMDLGCGTGNFAVPFAYEYGFQTTGIDASPQMLSVAKKRDAEGRIRWLDADVEALDEIDPADVVFMSHLLHHLRSPAEFLGKCFEYIRPGGSIWVRFGAMEHIRDDVVHRLFPATVAIDAERTPSTAQVEAWLREAGFQNVKTEASAQRAFSSASERLRSVQLKGTSVLTLISDADFQEGLSRLEKYAGDHPDDPWLLDDTISLTRGFRT